MIWKDIPNYEGKYKISNTGIVYSYKSNKILRPSKSNGYRLVMLWDNGVQKGFGVHRLVALTFIPNPNNLPEVNHINADRNDNRVENLEWVTHKDNNAHKRKTNTNNAKWIKCLETGQIFTGGATEAAQVNNGYKHMIRKSAISNGKYADKGFHYIYVGGENYEPHL